MITRFSGFTVINDRLVVEVKESGELMSSAEVENFHQVEVDTGLCYFQSGSNLEAQMLTFLRMFKD